MEQEDCREEGGREYFRGIGGGGTSSLPLPVDRDSPFPRHHPHILYQLHPRDLSFARPRACPIRNLI